MKINGDPAKAHYEGVDPESGEITDRLPEYTTMSLKPAIGKNWYSRFKDDAYPSDFVVLRGKEMKPPKYYDRLLELEDPQMRAAIKTKREEKALLHDADASTARLLVREKVKLAQIGSLKRTLD